MTTWFTDDNGNRASLEKWGSEEAARASLATLKGCSGCSDCSDCSYCSDCSDCSYCSGCSRCSYCSGCSDCSYCSGCSGKTGLKSESATQPTIPTIDNIHTRVFQAASAPASLDMGSWHNSCGTSHCRAGWVVHLAGEPGYALEKFFNTELAAMLIYRESAPDLRVSPVRFYETNEQAFADMKRMADLEASKMEDAR